MQDFEQHPRLKRIEVPHPQEYNKEHHDFLESILMLLEQKGIARWGHDDKTDEELSESREMLAEHIGGLNLIARAVKEQAIQNQDTSITSLDWEKVDRMIQVHDLAEIIFGDKIYKNAFDEDEEDRAQQIIINEAEKRNMGDWVADTLAEYWEKHPDGSKGSREANFVKTLDEIDGVGNMFISRRLDKDKRGYGKHIEYFETYARDFPALKAFGLYMNQVKEEYRHDTNWALHAGQEEFDFQDGTTQ